MYVFESILIIKYVFIAVMVNAFDCYCLQKKTVIEKALLKSITLFDLYTLFSQYQLILLTYNEVLYMYAVANSMIDETAKINHDRALVPKLYMMK